MRHRMFTPMLAGLLVAACYHATIETGRPASPEVLEKPFANAWIYGLVPPSAVSTAQRCPNGVAKVETKLSFVNQLVGFITLGIYTPMNTKVTCAGSGSSADDAPAADVRVRNPADAADVQRSFQTAADLAVTLARPVLVRF